MDGPPDYLSRIPGIAWPPVLDGDAATLAALIAAHDRSQFLPPDEIAARQRRQLTALASHFTRHSPHFRARLIAAGLDAEALGRPGGLQRLPPLTRRDLQSAAGLFAEPPESHGAPWTSRTSGSTGEPVVIRRTAISRLDWLALTMRDHFWHGRDFTARMASVRPVDAIIAREDWGAPAALLFATGPSLQLPITMDSRELLRRLADFGTESLLIYPGTLAALGEASLQTGVGLDRLRWLRTIGETLSDDARARAATIFGIAPIDVYSSQECGYIALQCPQGHGYHVMAETMIVEIVGEDGAPCAPGETGRVLITDLHNFATPLIRYAIGDHAEQGGSCRCGRGLPVLNRVLGRERNLILMPDGTRHWPQVGFAGFRAIAPVRQYQVLQIERAVLEVRLVTERPLTAQEEAALAAHIAQSLGAPFAIGFRYFQGRLPPGANGKFEEFKCLVEPPPA